MQLLTCDKVLMHYDPHLLLTLACDASAYGRFLVFTSILCSPVDVGMVVQLGHQPRTSPNAGGEYKGLPTMAAVCIQRWAITPSANNYQILYRQSEEHADADELLYVLLPLTMDAGAEAMSAYIVALVSETCREAPLSPRQIAKCTRMTHRFQTDI